MTNGGESGILGWLQRLPSWAAGALALVGVSVVVGGAIFGYRTYEYIEHDNDFCMSCHLMQDPYDRFARSAHRGLGCKACHHPTFVARSEMALTQIIENPDTLASHAEVPNEKCASCHIEGDPEKWDIIKNSAGHRIHFESDDPSLQGLKCVECHSTSLHEFSAASETCAQSGCHEDATVKLGKMSNLTIHCTGCHGFSTPVPPGQSAQALATAVTPDAETCLSCHAMRLLVEMPEDEPHDKMCGACHNPHTQTTPQQAVESCTKAGCHSQPDTLTPFHRGLEPGVLERCTMCHEAHTWRAQETDCLGCHEGIFQSDPPPGRVIARAEDYRVRGGTVAGGTVLASATAVFDPGPSRLHETSLAPPPQQVGGSAPDSLFRHADHRGVRCTACHSTEQTHGRVMVTTLQDCRSCHHTQPVAASCARCHQSDSGPARTFRETRTMNLTVGRRPDRQLAFNHEPHQGIACSRCHTSGLALSAAAVDCTACHERHHQPDVRCSSCHREPPASAHPTEEVHRTCSGSGCHQEVPVAGVPDTRNFCLTCHQDMEDHRPGRLCGQCHQISRTTAGGRP